MEEEGVEVMDTEEDNQYILHLTDVATEIITTLLFTSKKLLKKKEQT